MFYINTRLVGSGTFSGYLGNLTFFSIGDGYHKTSVEVFFVYVYSKLLSEQEIQQIYDNPWNPPTDGLAAWYAPDSVDTANNVWKDKLGNFDATIAVAYDYIRLSTISKFTESHVASFNGTGYFSVVNVSQSLNITNQITVEALVRLKEKVYNFEWIAEGPGWQFRSVTDGNYAIGFWIYNGTSWEPRVQWAYDDGLLGSWLDLIVTYDGSYLKLYVNGKLVASTVRTGDIDVPALYFKIGRAFTGDIAYVRVWSRSLNSTEIREIYEHPLDPPKDGLVLFYSPYSYDPTSGKWLNIAPIFPTVPLAEELDAQNYGAEAVRVSIPQLAVYDIENNSEIPISNVSVSMLANNTTISLVPSLLTLPWNSTVTLNVSASGYLPRLLQTPTSITSLAVYLYPAPSENSTTTPPNWTNNFTMPDINGTGWSGWQIGKEALSLNFDKAIQLFFTQNPNSKAQAFLPFAIWLGMTVLGLVFSQSPLVALTLGVITQASLAGLGAKLDMRLLPGVVTLYLFLFIWILKDFIESRKAD
ncbi:LamG domain-containing protein [Thermococcus henrietii]|uniref:LamG domain-containing protein n=1 Tax=Thermococcus henrietii TaxID=2016361 RepID=UPI001CB77FCC|nr:LamG domain-containing protein [Thermococcus henrietii]